MLFFDTAYVFGVKINLLFTVMTWKPVLPFALVALLCSLLPHAEASSVQRSYESHDYYVLEHDPTTGVSLHDVLQSLNVEYVEQAGQLQNHWLVRRLKEETKALEARSADPLSALLKKRTSSDAVPSPIKYIALQTPRKRVKRDGFSAKAPPLPNFDNMSSTEVAALEGIVDPAFPEQWHLVNDDFPMHSVNVARVWDMGITGEGVIAAMVDDGLDYESDDLAGNFDAENSYDFNLHVDLPKPVLFDDHHGTRCAGQIAAVKNNVCGVGIAYKSKVAGIRILSGPISDVDEAAALNYGYNNTSIYSCSWGPADDGRSMEGPSFLIQKAVVNGILNGRDGKGSIFVFASGNGAAQDDQCNFDGYTNSIYSVTVAAVDYKGLHPYYSEACAANMIVTYSSGSGKHIVTTDVGKDKCSHSHGGTSAAAPNAVGIFTLALSVRPDLTWRDIQHLCVRTAKMINPTDPDWENTAVGRRFSYKYGYGSLDAYSYVRAARTWKLVKPQAWLHTEPIQLGNGVMTLEGAMSGGEPIVSGGVTSKVTITEEMLQETNFEKLEHVTVRVWIHHTRRGDVQVELLSPKGVKSVLAGSRKYDQDKNGYQGWTFMTIKHWDEYPVGDWSLRVSDQEKEEEHGNFLGWTMTLWGSVIDPSKAKTFVLADPDVPFPPPASPDDTPYTKPSVTTSKTRPRPTEHLPGDHGTAEGEADKPAFSSGKEGVVEPTSSSGTVTPTPTESLEPTPDEGWFPDMDHLMKNSKWFFGAMAAVFVFGISAAAYFFWKRRIARRSNYQSVAGEDVRLRAMERGGPAAGTKELYDAFGEVSDDDDADEETGLRRPLTQGAIGFHSGFLDDEPTSSHSPVSQYKDEPGEAERRRDDPSNTQHLGSGARSPVSADSWEHADAP